MATQARRFDVSSPEIEDDLASSTLSDQETRPRVAAPPPPPPTTTNTTHLPKSQSIENYVRNVLRQHGPDDQLNEIRIEKRSEEPSKYENVSAFRQYNSNDDLNRRIPHPSQLRTNQTNEPFEVLFCFSFVSKTKLFRLLFSFFFKSLV